MKYLIKYPVNKDVGQMKALWKSAFGDEQPLIDNFFKTLYSHDNALIAKNGDEVCGCVYIIDGFLNSVGGKSYKCGYVYAAVTKSEHRGRGIMRELIAALCDMQRQRGAAALLLVPSEKELFDYYKKLGFVTAFYKEKAIVASTFSKGEILSCDGSEFLARRAEFLKTKAGYFDFDEKGKRYRLSEFGGKRRLLLYSDGIYNGYIVGELNGREYDIIETDLPLSGVCRAAYRLKKQYGCELVKCEGFGRRTPYGMIKSLNDELNEYDIAFYSHYINMMLE